MRHPTHQHFGADLNMSDIEQFKPKAEEDPEPESAEQVADLEMFERYLEEDLEMDIPSRGDLRQGVIVEMRGNEILVNVGSKRDGVVPQSDLARLESEIVKGLHVGQTVDVVVSRQPDDEGIFLLSMAEAEQQKDWLKAQELLESGEITEHRVIGYNKGGLTVEFNQLRGFVPASHVVDMPRNLNEDQRREQFEKRINLEMNLKVIEVERRRRRLVMSQMLAEREIRDAMKEKLFETLAVGDIIEGEVRSIRPFGAFVDIGGADGLLHVSEIDWAPVNHPRDVLQVGDMTTVEVIRLDPERHRIALSRKRVLPNPWDDIGDRYIPSTIVPVIITRVVDFGAFAQLEPGVEGLIHISELADIAVAEPLKAVKRGDEIEVKILRVDPQRQRIGLSRRQALQDMGVADPSLKANEDAEQQEVTWVVGPAEGEPDASAPKDEADVAESDGAPDSEE
jgi:small subunit ribosomal protein S1